MEKLTLKYKGKSAVYWTDKALSYGDYSGSGSVGQANCEVLWKEINEREIDYCDTSFQSIYCMENGLEFYGYLDLPLPSVIEAVGIHRSRQLYIREDCKPLMDLIKRLDEYPCIDEHHLSHVEAEWELEAWDSWLRRDLTGCLDEDLYEACEEDKIPDEDLYELYREAMEKTNTYPVPENSGVYIDVERIRDTFNDLVRQYAIDHKLPLNPESEEE